MVWFGLRYLESLLQDLPFGSNQGRPSTRFRFLRVPPLYIGLCLLGGSSLDLPLQVRNHHVTSEVPVLTLINGDDMFNPSSPSQGSGRCLCGCTIGSTSPLYACSTSTWCFLSFIFYHHGPTRSSRTAQRLPSQQA